MSQKQHYCQTIILKNHRSTQKPLVSSPALLCYVLAMFSYIRGINDFIAPFLLLSSSQSLPAKWYPCHCSKHPLGLLSFHHSWILTSLQTVVYPELLVVNTMISSG